MKFNKYLICALFLVLICCIGAASAADADDAVAADDAIDEEVTEALDVSDEVVDDSLGVSEEPALSDGKDTGSDLNEVVIYVGQNKTDGGNGSYDNPFSTLYLACDYANTKNTSQVTLYLYNGTYDLLDVPLKFNTSNLIINGIGSPTIKSLDSLHYQGFSLVSSSNYTFSNIITTDCLFNGNADNGVFNNCSFVSYSGEPITLPNSNNYELKFNNCRFETSYTSCIFLSGSPLKSQVLNIKFENCIFDLPNCPSLVSASQTSTVTMVNCWLGKNTFPAFITPGRGYIVDSKGRYVSNWEISVDGYAQFSISENYLGNNQYEIIGKLAWNDENNNASMENFKPMNVSLSSNTGEIQSNVILTNGTFSAIYTSDSSEHSVIAILGSEIKELNFNSINFTVDAPSIFYGEDQNVTVTFPQVISNNITITVNNKTYDVEVNNTNSTTFTIEDRLTEGNYTVDVLYIDDVNKVYGSNSTILSVSRVSDYTFNPEINDNGDIKVGDELTITVELPSDVSGNVTVKVNDNPVITKEATPNTVITISNLVGGNNNITIAYTGNDKYAAKTSEPQVVTAQKVSAPEGDNALNITAPADSATPTYSINMPKDATGNLTVIVDGKDKYTKELVNGSATITLPELSAGKHDINVTYTGDAKYESISKTTSVNVPAKSTPAKTPVAKKAATKITAKKKTFKAKKKVKKYTITLKSGKKPVKKVWVTLKIKGKKLLKAKTNAKGKATFKIKKLTKKGKYNAVIKFKGNKNYKASSKKVKITIKK